MVTRHSSPLTLARRRHYTTRRSLLVRDIPTPVHSAHHRNTAGARARHTFGKPAWVRPLLHLRGRRASVTAPLTPPVVTCVTQRHDGRTSCTAKSSTPTSHPSPGTPSSGVHAGLPITISVHPVPGAYVCTDAIAGSGDGGLFGHTFTIARLHSPNHASCGAARAPPPDPAIRPPVRSWSTRSPHPPQTITAPSRSRSEFRR